MYNHNKAILQHCYFADDLNHQQNSNAMIIQFRIHNKTAEPSMGTVTSKPHATNTEIYNTEKYSTIIIVWHCYVADDFTK